MNPHGLPRQILSLVRLPISPLSHWWYFEAEAIVADVTEGARDDMPMFEKNRYGDESIGWL